MSISTQPPQVEWPQQPQVHPFGDRDCWANPLSKDERLELARFLGAWTKFFYAAADARMTARRGLSPSASHRLSVSMMRASAECGDLRMDVTERAAVAA